MLAILNAMKNNLTEGRPVILASVAMSSGATPRSAGAHMVVGETGLLAGTIGGGSVEYRAIEQAQELIQKKQSYLHNYILNQRDIEDLGMVCGGDVVVRFLYLSPTNADILRGLTEGIEALERKKQTMLVTGLNDTRVVFLVRLADRLVGDGGGLDKEKLLAEIKAHRARRIVLENDLVAESMMRMGRVVIFGGGHVGMALAHVLVPLDFHVVVLDDREAFVKKERYPAVVETATIDLTDVAASFTIQPDDFVCVMTRGHRFDQIVQAQMLKTDAHYIGVIGSRFKTKTVFANLKQEYGFTNQDLARITTPIGIEMLAETPEEIAISIAGQLIDVRAKREKEDTI